MKVVYSQKAQNDLSAIALFYTDQEGEILAQQFASSAEESIKNVETFPDAGVPVENTMRRVGINKFTHHNIFYTTGNNIITIVRVLHDRQDIDNTL